MAYFKELFAKNERLGAAERKAQVIPG